MKKQWIATALTFATAGLSAQGVFASETETQTRVEIPVQALLAPETGFEEKNSIQVVLYGDLPNTCYTLAEATTETLDEHTIRVRQYAIRETGGMCADESSMPEHMKMIVPFMQEVMVGHLLAGDYRFEFTKAGSGGTFRAMTVSKNVTPTVDTLPYAAVSGVQAKDVISSLDHVMVTLSGVLNSTCTTLDQNVKIMREDDVLVLLPTIKVQHGVLCAQIILPFQKRLDLGALPPGIHLIHTRSMNGKAVNKVINVMK